MKRKKLYTATINTLRLVPLVFVLTVTLLVAQPAKPAAACDLYQSTPVTQIIVPWYKYLEGEEIDGICRPTMTVDDFKNGKNVTLIAVAIIELLTRVSGLIAVGFVIYGAFQYILSQGEPEGLKNAKNTITNALVGFVIVLLSTAIVQFLGRALK